MGKGFLACLAACGLIGALLIAPLALPGPALAESAVVSEETPLLQDPGPDAPAVAHLALGTEVTIDGPPVDGYYPVTADTLSGWLRGEHLVVAKDVVASDNSTSPSPVESDLTGEDGQPASSAPAVGAASDDAPIASELAADPAGGEVAEPVSSMTDPASVPSSPDALPGDAGTEALAAEPVVPPVPPDDTPIAAPDAGPLGPASVTAEAPIFAGPGEEYGLISTALSGSTVEQTGHLVNGFVTVRYGGITGWAPVDHLAPPNAAPEYGAPSESVPVAAATPVPAA